MAESIMKFLHGHRVYIDSAGVRSKDIDGFAIAVMDEIGIDLSRHHAKTFDDLEDDFFDVVITLSPEAQHRAVELTRVMACEVEFWNTMDPSLVESEDRETVLNAYRQVRDHLLMKIKQRFPVQSASDT
jgi:protein-tyrosine-phosphatase